MNEEITAVARQIGVLHERHDDDIGAVADAVRESTRQVRETHVLDEIVETRRPRADTTIERPKESHPVRKTLAVVALGASLVGAGNHYLETSGDYALGFGKAPAFEGAQSWTAGEGDGISAAVNEVEGYNSVDSRFITDKIKQTNVDALLDGLQNGETLEIPDSVKTN